jgi:hypothetical protein
MKISIGIRMPDIELVLIELNITSSGHFMELIVLLVIEEKLLGEMIPWILE